MSSIEERKLLEAKTRRGASFGGATFNFIKGMMGAGILGLGHACNEAGYALSAGLGLLLCFICFATMTLLVRSKREANYSKTGDEFNGPYVTYKDVAGFAFGKKGELAISIAILIQQLCFASGWMIVITNTMQTLVPDFPRYAIVLWFLPIVVILSWIRYIKHLVPFSFLGCVVYAFGIIGVTYYYSIPRLTKENISQTSAIIWKTCPLFMSTFTYAVLGIIGVLPNESSLKSPSQANGVIGFSMIFYGGNALVFGIIAYLAGFGIGDTIIVSLPQKDVLVTVVKIALVFALVMTHPLGMNYAADPFEDKLWPITNTQQKSINGSPNHDENSPLVVNSDDSQSNGCKPLLKRFWKSKGRYVFRSCLATLTCIIALAVPNFSIFSNFVGSFFLSFVGFVVPPLIYLKIVKTRTFFGSAIAVIVCAFGFGFMVIGNYVAILHALHK